ncbi:LOW QUALITY PROTEIN: endoplasmic reticulum junction formation protein lunapark-like [Impatiens glandulifera]|uniref:LOW QUALITY PROTEIN: endoplasmic reticulum junction formation protein lunapark-like n=1 Tax=Impatiens glandulifera TaxID=253017 RepID=UPI001FB0C5FC|nr:LOW QUALITY PROTEIN: endoplasmic reticulum junction formation protein lunapark-like [Impatiens glandulifera]
MDETSDLHTKGKKDNETTKKKQRGFYLDYGTECSDYKMIILREASVYIAMEERKMLFLARMRERAQRWRMTARHLIVFTVIWRFRLEMIRKEKPENCGENLGQKRKAKIDELKEKTNYYITQQLIQRYDTDPAAKAAAAAVLASKLGADSGLKVHLGDGNELNNNLTSGKSNDVEFVQSSGLRNRKAPLYKSNSTESSTMLQNLSPSWGWDDDTHSVTQNELVVEHYSGTTKYNNGWIAQIAALLVGEDPAQSYALICGNCHMHNGLSRKEDYPYITYYCPHCHALNKPKNHDGLSGPDSPTALNSNNVVGDGLSGLVPPIIALNNVVGGSVDNHQIPVSSPALLLLLQKLSPEIEKVRSIDPPTPTGKGCFCSQKKFRGYYCNSLAFVVMTAFFKCVMELNLILGL